MRKERQKRRVGSEREGTGRFLFKESHEGVFTVPLETGRTDIEGLPLATPQVPQAVKGDCHVGRWWIGPQRPHGGFFSLEGDCTTMFR
jgi:hypothetical protein